jgi:hypothetical protein
MRKKSKFKVVDLIKVIDIPKDLKDSARIKTPRVFKNALGKTFQIQNLDEYGHLELQVTDRDWIWLEPEFAQLSKPTSKSTKSSNNSLQRRSRNARPRWAYRSMVNMKPHTIALVCGIIALGGCGGEIRSHSSIDPSPKDISEEFSDVSMSLPSISNATFLARIDGLKGNTLTLTVPISDYNLLTSIASSFNLRTEQLLGQQPTVTMQSKTDAGHPWRFRLVFTNSVLTIRGTQPYD